MYTYKKVTAAQAKRIQSLYRDYKRSTRQIAYDVNVPETNVVQLLVLWGFLSPDSAATYDGTKVALTDLTLNDLIDYRPAESSYSSYDSGSSASSYDSGSGSSSYDSGSGSSSYGGGSFD